MFLCVFCDRILAVKDQGLFLTDPDPVNLIPDPQPWLQVVINVQVHHYEAVEPVPKHEPSRLKVNSEQGLIVSCDDVTQPL